MRVPARVHAYRTVANIAYLPQLLSAFLVETGSLTEPTAHVLARPAIPEDLPIALSLEPG